VWVFVCCEFENTPYTMYLFSWLIFLTITSRILPEHDD
jgi:hypothetical protein